MSHHDRRRTFQQRQAAQAAQVTPPPAPRVVMDPVMAAQIMNQLADLTDAARDAATAAESTAMWTGLEALKHRHW